MVVCDPVKRVLSRYYHMYDDDDEIKLETFEDQVRFSLNRIQEQGNWDRLSAGPGRVERSWRIQSVDPFSSCLVEILQAN